MRTIEEILSDTPLSIEWMKIQYYPYDNPVEITVLISGETFPRVIEGSTLQHAIMQMEFELCD